jgi:WD40 repeat protein
MMLAPSIALLLLAAPPVPPIVALAVTPDGSQVVTGSQAGVQLRSLPELAVTRSLATKLVQVNDLAFSPDGKLLAVAGGSPAERGAVEIWTWPAAALKTTLPAGDDLAYRVAWNAAGSQLAIAGGDRKVRIAALGGDETKTYECHSGAVLAAAWLPAENLVLSAGVDQSIRVLEPATGKIRRSFDNHTAAIRDLAIRPGEHAGPVMVASCAADRTVRFWQPTIGRLVRFARLPSPPIALAWTPSGSHVLAACEDGRLRSVDPESIEVKELAPTLTGVAYAAAVLPDGKFAVLAGAAGELRIVALDAIKP